MRWNSAPLVALALTACGPDAPAFKVRAAPGFDPPPLTEVLDAVVIGSDLVVEAHGTPPDLTNWSIVFGPAGAVHDVCMNTLAAACTSQENRAVYLTNLDPLAHELLHVAQLPETDYRHESPEWGKLYDALTRRAHSLPSDLWYRRE